MSWHDFLQIYLAATLLVGLVSYRAFYRGKEAVASRVVLLALFISIPFDAVAEMRSFWTFSSLIGINLFEVPIENVAFMLASFFNTLTIYLGVSAAATYINNRNVCKQRQETGEN